MERCRTSFSIIYFQQITGTAPICLLEQLRQTGVRPGGRVSVGDKGHRKNCLWRKTPNARTRRRRRASLHLTVCLRSGDLRGFQPVSSLSRQRKRLRRLNGGEGGIRTPDRLTPMSDFESGAFNRALPPLRVLLFYLRTSTCGSCDRRGCS